MRRFNKGFIMTEKLKTFTVPYSETVYGIITIVAENREKALEALENGDCENFEQTDSDYFEYFADEIIELD
jgi:hypothetical protein